MTGENALRSSSRPREDGGNLGWHAEQQSANAFLLSCKNPKKVEGKQRKTVLKLCRGDRSNLAVKCLPVLHCWHGTTAAAARDRSTADYSDMAAGRESDRQSGSSFPSSRLLDAEKK